MARILAAADGAGRRRARRLASGPSRPADATRLPSRPCVRPRISRSRRPRVKIQEADAKSLLVAQGLPVPPGRSPAPPPRPAPRPNGSSPPGARAGRDQGPGARRRPGQGRRRQARRLGRRGRGGRRADPRHGDQGHHRSARCSSRPAADIVKEYYLSAVLDRAERPDPAHGLGRGRRGDRAGRGRATPMRSSTVHADPLLGLPDYQARELAFAMGFGGHLKAAVAIAKGLVADDARLRRRPRRDQPARGRPRARRRRDARSSGSSASTRRSRSTTRRSPRHPDLEDAARPGRGGPGRPRGARGRSDVHQARRHDRLHGQRRRARDDDDGPRQARRRRAGELPRHRRRREGRQGRRPRCG